MAGFDNDCMYADNADFTTAGAGGGSATNGLQTNGQLWIGTTALNVGGTHVNVGSITSPNSSITFGYSSPNITAVVNTAVLPPYYSLTPYIVGKTGDTHAQFTGNEAIQAAINQAVTDGHSLSNPANIYIKPGTYTPASTFITLHNGINLYAMDNVSYSGQALVNLNATFKIASGTTFVAVNGITVSAPGSSVFFDFTAIDNSTVQVTNCYLYGNSSDIVNSILSGSISFSLNNCNVSAGKLFSLASFLSALNMTVNDSVINVQSTATLSATNSSFILISQGSVILSGDTVLATATGDGQLTINNAYSSILDTFNSSGSTVPASIYVARQSSLGDVSVLGTGATLGTFDSVTSQYQTISSQSRYNLYAGNQQLSVLNNFVAMDTSAARAVTLPAASTKGLTFTIKDVTGTAGTNAITITDPNMYTIDGAASLVIGTNYGSATLTFDGTSQWFIS